MSIPVIKSELPRISFVSDISFLSEAAQIKFKRGLAWLFRNDGMSWKQISEILDMSYSSVQYSVGKVDWDMRDAMDKLNTERDGYCIYKRYWWSQNPTPLETCLPATKLCFIIEQE